MKSPEVDAYVRIKRGQNVLKEISDIGSKVGIEDKNIIQNTMYIKSMGLDFGIILPVTIVGIVVVLAAVMVIYNIFYISIAERVREFGLLRAVGATKKQIKKIILKEGILLSAIGLSNNQLITMLQFEGIYYAIISIAITMTLGTSIGYLCFRLFKNAGASYAQYKSPIISLLLFSLALVILEILLAFVTQKLLRKESIVDRIKYSE